MKKEDFWLGHLWTFQKLKHWSLDHLFLIFSGDFSQSAAILEGGTWCPSGTGTSQLGLQPFRIRPPPPFIQKLTLWPTSFKKQADILLLLHQMLGS